jgi:hypothetical protein
MADDWAEKNREARRQRRQEKQQQEQEVQKRRRFAANGAGELFGNIQKRITQDVGIYKEDVVFQSLEVQLLSDVKFVVRRRGSPKAEATISLDVTMIMCEYTFGKKNAKERQATPRPSRTLRVCADSDGALTVYKNGNGQACADESEVSEYILTPLLDYVDSL